jgi:hypothetical protein
MSTALIFPGRATRLERPFQNPGGLTGSREEMPAKKREIRDRIGQRVIEFAGEHSRKRGAR